MNHTGVFKMVEGIVAKGMEAYRDGKDPHVTVMKSLHFVTLTYAESDTVCATLAPIVELAPTERDCTPTYEGVKEFIQRLATELLLFAVLDRLRDEIDALPKPYDGNMEGCF